MLICHAVIVQRLGPDELQTGWRGWSGWHQGDVGVCFPPVGRVVRVGLHQLPQDLRDNRPQPDAQVAGDHVHQTESGKHSVTMNAHLEREIAQI